MLQLHHFSITHQKDLHALISNLSLTVNPGDKVAIIGEEGTGKSTLLKWLAEPRLIEHYALVEGDYINHFSQIGYLPQTLPAHVLDQTIADFLYADLDYDRLDFNLLYRLSQDLQFDSQRFEDNKLLLSDLSGGEKLKLQLIKLLAHQPDLLLFDEPSSDLDLDSIIWLENFMRESPATIIFISHDERLLSQTATMIVHLELVKKRQKALVTVEKMDYQTYKQTRLERFERQNSLAQKEREEHAKKMARHHRIHQSVEHTLRNTHDSTAGRLLAKKMKVVLSQERKLQKEAENFTEIPYELDDINLFFGQLTPLSTSKHLLHYEQEALPTGQTITLDIWGQDKMVITGANGIGKTRLLKKIKDDLVAVFGTAVGYMPQDSKELDLNQTALDFLNSVGDAENARTLLASLRFTREEVHHPIADLSGGQLAKLYLAKFVLQGCQILILDEPTRHFAPTTQPHIRQLLNDFPGAIISVSHDRDYIDEVGQVVYQLDKARLQTIKHREN